MSKLQMVEIDIKSIIMPENYRAKVGDVSELMSSIKSNGLLQPIGVHKGPNSTKRYLLAFGFRRLTALKKLGYTKVSAVVLADSQNRVITNIVENLQRVETPLYDVGRAMNTLVTKDGLSVDEVAVRVGTNKAFVKRAIESFKITPESFRGKVVSMETTKKSKGKDLIPSTVSSMINQTARRYNLTKAQIKKLYAAASQKQLSNLQMKTVCALMEKGLTVEDALEKHGALRLFRAEIIMDAKEYARLQTKYGAGWVQAIMDAQTVDKIKPITKSKVLKRKTKK